MLVRASERNGGVGTGARAVAAYRQSGASRSSGVDKPSAAAGGRSRAPPVGSESIRHVGAVSTGFTDESVVEANRTGIRIVLVQAVGDVAPVGEVLDPGTGVEAGFGGTLERHPCVGDAVGALRNARRVVGVEVLLGVVIAVDHQPQIPARDAGEAPVDPEAPVVVRRLDQLVAHAAGRQLAWTPAVRRMAHGFTLLAPPLPEPSAN